MCTAIRVWHLIDVLKDAGMSCRSVTKEEVEAELLSCGDNRRSQQKFLHPKSSDSKLHAAVKGVGGNTTTERCIIISQSLGTLNLDHLDKIRKGLLASIINVCNTISLVSACVYHQLYLCTCIMRAWSIMSMH